MPGRRTLLLAVAGLLFGAGQASAATTYPVSSGASGPCDLTVPAVIDTTALTMTGIGAFPGATVEPAAGATPERMVLHCTTFTLTATVSVVGTRALEVRATGPVQIDGVLNLSANGSINPGPGGGAGGSGGGMGAGASAGTAGSGPGGGGGGQPGTNVAGAGGVEGPAYNPPGGMPGTSGTTVAFALFGGGGGGAGSGGGFGAAVDLPEGGFAAGSGGGGGGSNNTGTSNGGNGGEGGGALRIITPSSIVVNSDIYTQGGTPSTPEANSPYGGAGGGGSGGGIVLIAPSVSLGAAGRLDTDAGDGTVLGPETPNAAPGGDGSPGQIGIAGNTISLLGTAFPNPALVRKYSDIVSVTKAGSGSGTVTGLGINCGLDCIEAFDPGTILTLTATPDPGSTFAGWSGPCTLVDGTCSLDTPGDRSVTATFNLSPTAPPAGVPPVVSQKKKCRKGRKLVKRKGKRRCVKKKRRK